MLGRGIIGFYAEGFRRMRLGRTLWAIILLKLVIIFAVLRLFFFQPALHGTNTEKEDAVFAELTRRISTEQH